jgi:serine O-acetyltransferase
MRNLSKRFNFLRKFLACDMPFSLMRRRDVRFPHAVGVVVSNAATIGRNVTIFQNVTIGGKESGANQGFPKIGDSVTIYAGAIVVGGVTIGEGATIGANATVTKDVPPGATVYSEAPLRER